MRKDVLLGACFAVSSLMLGGCGGGGGGGTAPSSASFVPSMPAQPLASATTTASVAISLQVPGVSASAMSRRLQYVSSSTKSMSIAVNGGAPNVTNCTATCTTVVTAPIGTVSFTVTLFDATNGTGNVLSSGTTVAVVVAGRSNTLSLALNGAVASVSVILGNTSVTSGSSATIPVSVVAKDSAGNAIVGPEPYVTPISLALADPSGATALSTTSLASPGAVVTLSYNGSAAFNGASIAASVPGVAPSAANSVRLAVSAPPASIGVSSNVPSHVLAMYYYGLNGVNTQIPPAFMAAHADFVESDLNEGTRGADFKNAGGKYSLLYTDPNYVPYCQPPFTPPSGTCHAAMGDAPESAWFHGADGSRIRHQVDAHFGYQESLNPAAPAAQAAWHAYTTQLAASAPSTDYFFADDSGGDLKGGDFYGFNAPEVEVQTDAQWLAGRMQLFAQATRPLVLNGIGSDGMPAYNGAYLDSSNVAGLNLEGCFSSSDAGRPSGSAWTRQANGLLAALKHHKLAICMSTGTQTPANRIYYVASYWLIYDPTYSVAGSVVTMPDGYVVEPAFDIVPRDPIASASSDVASLQTANGTYVREFAHCYQQGRLIGRCATVVNTSQSAVSLTSLANTYAHSLALNANSSYTDGAATWSASVPTQVPATSAVVLAQ